LAEQIVCDDLEVTNSEPISETVTIQYVRLERRSDGE
jgi:hypothetical protein